MGGITIVAIPRDGEPVWKYSSEKVPHLTLLHMDGVLKNEENTLQFVQHAAKISLSRFGLSVKRRGTLGSKDADVLFFDTAHSVDKLRDFRAHLLTNPDISNLYVASEQFPGWTPHLTMGYPDTPAKDPDDNDRYALDWINFDKIAIWTGDFDGPEFELEEDSGMMLDDSAAWSALVGDDVLIHYGRKGMKWGVRRDAKALGGAAAYAKAKTRDAAWAAKVEANPKLGKVSAKANRIARRLTKKLKKDYKANGYNLRKDSLARSRYDSELKDILQNSLDKASYKVHKNSPSRLSEVSIHRHPDGSIIAIVQPRQNRKLVKQQGQIARRDAKRAESELRQADPDMIEDEDGLYDDLVFTMTTDDEGYVDDISVPFDELSQSEIDEIDNMSDLDDVLIHYGRLGMRWGVRRQTDSSGLVKGTVEGAIKSGQKPRAEDALATIKKGKKTSNSDDHTQMEKTLGKKVETLSTAEIKELTKRLKAVDEFKVASEKDRLAKASARKRLTEFVLGSVKEGIKERANLQIKGLSGDLIEDVFKGAGLTTKAQKEKIKKEQADKAKAEKSSKSEPKQSRDEAIKALTARVMADGSYKVTDLDKDKGG